MLEAKAITAGCSDKRLDSAAVPKGRRTFRFVPAHPRSEVERRETRLLVRSNASNFHWQRVKKFGEPAHNAPPTGPRHRQPAHSSTKHSWRALAPLAPRVLNPLLPGDENGGVGGHDDREERGPEAKEEEVLRVGETAPQRMNSPLNSVGLGHIDPFATHPSALPMAVVSPILDQIKHFLLQMFPPKIGTSDLSIAEMWFRKCFQDRGIFHAAFYCHFARMRAITSREDECREQVYCYSEAIREIHRKFENPSTACVDDNILAVFALAYNGDVRRDKPSHSPTSGPLKALQVLDIYGGRLETVHVHLQGLAKMLSIRGGLSKIRLPGLAHLISYGDVITACRNLTRPTLPLASLHPDLATSLSAACRPDHPLHGLGRGFQVLLRLLQRQNISKLLSVMRCLVQYTLAVDDYVQGRDEAQTLSILADERNYVQHSILCLIPSPGSAEAEEETALYSLCKLAMLVYSMIIVFPLPAVGAPFPQLATQIKQQLLHPNIHTRWKEAAEFFFWVTAMGAIASIGTKERHWFIASLDRLTHRLKIYDWLHMREHLSVFLWFASTNDVDGLDLWKEIEASSPFHVPDQY